MKSLLLALVCFVAVYGQEQEYPVQEEDRPLIRCKRLPICTHQCESGFRTDGNGCPTCNCNDRCEHHQCEPGTICKMEEKTPICIALNACPQMNCAMHCVFGFRQAEDGCDICECKETPCDGYTCPHGMKCVSDKGECERGNCNLKALCLPDPLQTKPTAQPMPCPIPMCAMDHECEFGFKNSEHGCQMCQCRASPCDTEMCGDGEVCIEHATKCQKEICPKEPKCIGRALCHRQAEQRRLATSILMPGPALFGAPRARRATKTSLDCDETGTFKPLQCADDSSECWCVDDRGIEIPNSRKVTKEGARPECHYNRTKGVHGSFELTHSLDNVEPHMNNIKKLAHLHLSNWLHMEEEYVTIVEITPSQTNIIQVHFEVMWDEETDMATAIYHVQYLMLKGHCQINYQGGTLIPDPKSMDVHHHYEPKLPNESGWTGEHYPTHGDGFMGFVHSHQTGIIAAVFGATMLILLVAIVSFARRRRLSSNFNHRRMDTYRENLAFSNQLYGKQNLMPDDIKEPLSSVEVVPAAEDKKTDENGPSVA